MTRPGEEEAIRAVRAAAFPADEAANAVAAAYPFIADERDAEIERLRAALRRRNEAPSDEQLAIFVARASRQRGSRPWRIVGYLARCLQDERDRAADASAPDRRVLVRECPRTVPAPGPKTTGRTQQ